MDSFTTRLKRKFPQAKILMSSDEPSEELRASYSQILGITTLTRPPRALREELLAARNVRAEENVRWPAAKDSIAPSNVASYRDNASLLGVFEYRSMIGALSLSLSLSHTHTHTHTARASRKVPTKNQRTSSRTCGCPNPTFSPRPSSPPTAAACWWWTARSS